MCMVSRSGAEKTREGVTPTDIQQPQPKDSTSLRKNRITRRTKAQGCRARDEIWEGRTGGEMRENPYWRVIAAAWKTGRVGGQE